MRWVPWLIVALVAMGMMWRMDRLSLQVTAERERADVAAQERDRNQQLIDLQAGVLAEQQRQLGRVADIERQTRQLGQALEVQGARHAAALRELKENDQAVRDWLLGRWSMLDIFVIAILVALVNFGNLASIEANLGAAAFASVVVLTMFAAVTFDPRLIWDNTNLDDENE